MKSVFAITMALIAGFGLDARAEWTADAEACFKHAGNAAQGNITACDRAIASKRLTNDERAKTYYNRALAYDRSGENERAISDNSHAIRLLPDYADALYNRGRLFYLGDRFDQAIADLNNAIRIKPNHANAHVIRGQSEHQKGALDAAKRDFMRALEIDPDNDYATVNLKALERDIAALEQDDRDADHAHALEIRQAQELLNQLGYDVGTVDGVAGNVTRQAVRSFQANQDLAVDGRVNAGLVEQLQSALIDQKRREQEWANRDETDPAIRVDDEIVGAGSMIEAQITVEDDKGVVELWVDGEKHALQDGRAIVQVDRMLRGERREIELTARDAAGNETVKRVAFVRSTRLVARPVAAFDRPDPWSVDGKRNDDAIAIIVAVEQYDLVRPAKFAKRDAQMFAEFAERALGVPPDRIEILTNDQATDRALIKTVRDMARRYVQAGRSDVYLFFSGHGRFDDNNMPQFLPFNFDPELMTRTSVGQRELIDLIMASSPRSLTLIADTCFSGRSRDDEFIVADADARFVSSWKAPDNTAGERSGLPGNVLILSAAQIDQPAWAIDEAEHGLFSYFLFKGLEGAADLDQDRQITMVELHHYLDDQIPRHARSPQRPYLGGKQRDRVLVQF